MNQGLGTNRNFVRHNISRVRPILVTAFGHTYVNLQTPNVNQTTVATDILRRRMFSQKLVNNNHINTPKIRNLVRRVSTIMLVSLNLQRHLIRRLFNMRILRRHRHGIVTHHFRIFSFLMFTIHQRRRTRTFTMVQRNRHRLLHTTNNSNSRLTARISLINRRVKGPHVKKLRRGLSFTQIIRRALNSSPHSISVGALRLTVHSLGVPQHINAPYASSRFPTNRRTVGLTIHHLNGARDHDHDRGRGSAHFGRKESTVRNGRSELVFVPLCQASIYGGKVSDEGYTAK